MLTCSGALITNALFFSASIRSDLGFVYMGIAILGVTSLLIFVYFPDMGSMFFPAGSLSYDPQRIKPPAGYRGADSLQYNKEEQDKATKATPSTVEVTTVSGV